ncbi:hypothetical protein [Streptomyces griseus]|uniref:hypothetical protein n=1 Tax=Streptomyces griseus TaxID=1911 RepID=UPI000B08DB45|nr:hypothetical protein [Streptomyces griseus]
MGSRNIPVNVAARGLTATPVLEASFQRRSGPEATRRRRAGQIPLQRVATKTHRIVLTWFIAQDGTQFSPGNFPAFSRLYGDPPCTAHPPSTA